MGRAGFNALGCETVGLGEEFQQGYFVRSPQSCRPSWAPSSEGGSNSGIIVGTSRLRRRKFDLYGFGVGDGLGKGSCAGGGAGIGFGVGGGSGVGMVAMHFQCVRSASVPGTRS